MSKNLGISETKKLYFREEFDNLFEEEGSDTGQRARQLAVVSGLNDIECRSIYWKFFLGMVYKKYLFNLLFRLMENLQINGLQK
jgi:hypothetical protein